MDLMVIRSNRQLESLIAFLKERNLPFACAIDEIYPVRSARFNAYYWGVVIKMIADHTGHSTEEVHEAYKKKYNLDLCFQFNQEKRIYEIAAGVMSTARENKRKFAEYVMKVRADAEITLGITIPLHNEVYVNELIFEHEL